MPGRARDLRFFRAFVLEHKSSAQKVQKKIDVDILESVRRSLPLPPELNSNLHTLINVLRPALIIHPKLQNIAILDLTRPRFGVRWAQPNMVQKSPGTALGVFHVKLATEVNPDLRVGTRDDFGSKSEFVGAESVDGCEAKARAVGKSTNTQCGVTLAEIARDGIESKGTSGI